MVNDVQQLGLLIKAVHRKATREVNLALRPLGITAAQAEALSVLAEHGPTSLNDLGELVIAEGGHPSRLVDRLVTAGWVERTPAADDRRRVVLKLTPAGQRVHDQARDMVSAAYADFAERMAEQDVAAACAALVAYLDGSELADVVRRRLAGSVS